MSDIANLTASIEELEQVFGKSSSAGFGSAVFYKVSKNRFILASVALDDYISFMGEKWNAETEATWMGAWKIVYERSPGLSGDILTELNNIKDAEAKRSVPLLTEFIENAEQGKLALAAVFNHQDVSQVQVFSVGDNEQMAGLLICGLFKDNSACSVICLMD